MMTVGVHHRISGQYLYQYANEMAWREDNRRIPNGMQWRAASARISTTLPQRQAARIVVRHPVNSAPHPQHHRPLALSNDLAHNQNPAVEVDTRVASSARVRTKKRAFDHRVLVGDEWRRVAHFGAAWVACCHWRVT
jgi:hypothetical protein